MKLNEIRAPGRSCSCSHVFPKNTNYFFNDNMRPELLFNLNAAECHPTYIIAFFLKNPYLNKVNANAMVQIANPIYDVVFKYLMKDKKVARLLLSAIIGREVIDLEFRPTEHPLSYHEMLTVLRMDFSARILDEHGKQELVILELQKAKLPSDIMRFRRYLGEQYTNKENVVREPKEAYPHRKALPILSIYFLGHTLEHIKVPVLRVNRRYIDAATGEEIHEKEEFIESLTHDSIIIQIPYLNGRRRTELEQLLTLFDQSNQSKDRHFLHVNEEELPKRYRPLLRRLQKAVADPAIRLSMDAEDDYIEDFKNLERKLSVKDQVIEEKDQVIEHMIRKMYQSGTSLEGLVEFSGMTVEEIEAILSRSSDQEH